MRLDIFTRKKGLHEKEIHPKFNILRESSQLMGERMILSEWTDGFVDRDNKIITEFQTTFHSSF